MGSSFVEPARNPIKKIDVDVVVADEAARLLAVCNCGTEVAVAKSFLRLRLCWKWYTRIGYCARKGLVNRSALA